MSSQILQTLVEYQWFAWTALIVAAASTPIAMVVARKLDVMDHPDQVLKPHARPTPYLGGAAILVGWSASVFLALGTGMAAASLLLPIWAGGVAVGVLGLIDDAREISPKLRLAVAAGVTLAVMWLTGMGFEIVDAATGVLGFELPRMLAVPLSLGIGLFIVLGAINATNLIDGLDGLCAGVTVIMAGAFAVLASVLLTQEFSSTGDPARLVLSLAVCGGAAGFLIFNFNPARIFMGDGGSVLLGYVGGMLIVMFAEQGSLRWLVAALMIFTLPVYDAALAIFRRYRSGKPLFVGDRSHFYDQLKQRGCGIKGTALICYAAASVFSLAGLSLVIHGEQGYLIPDGWIVPVFVGFIVLVALASYIGGFASPERRSPAADPATDSTSDGEPA
jgi:UDP-GlcNAc:undecaprenyl-phosphate GlcNAc-1-phosphate transferase